MTNHEVPEWENTPSKPSTQPNSFWQRLSQPFTSKKPSLTTPQPSIHHMDKNYETRSPLTDTQNFDKETGVAEPAAETSTTAEEISPRENRRRYWGRSRRTLILIVIAVVLLLALIIGLAVGLSHKSYVGLNTFISTLPI